MVGGGDGKPSGMVQEEEEEEEGKEAEIPGCHS